MREGEQKGWWGILHCLDFFLLLIFGQAKRSKISVLRKESKNVFHQGKSKISILYENYIGFWIKFRMTQKLMNNIYFNYLCKKIITAYDNRSERGEKVIYKIII